MEAQKAGESRQFHEAVTRVTPTFDDAEVVARATKGDDIRTEGEVWAEAYARDAVQWMLEVMGDAGARDGKPEADGPLWPEPGTPEWKRLDERNAAPTICTRCGV